MLSEVHKFMERLVCRRKELGSVFGFRVSGAAWVASPPSFFLFRCRDSKRNASKPRFEPLRVACPPSSFLLKSGSRGVFFRSVEPDGGRSLETLGFPSKCDKMLSEVHKLMERLVCRRKELGSV